MVFACSEPGFAYANTGVGLWRSKEGRFVYRFCLTHFVQHTDSVKIAKNGLEDRQFCIKQAAIKSENPMIDADFVPGSGKRFFRQEGGSLLCQ